MKEVVNLGIIILLLVNIRGEEHKTLDYLYSIELIKIKEEVDKEEDLIPLSLREEVEFLEIRKKKNNFIR